MKELKVIKCNYNHYNKIISKYFPVNKKVWVVDVYKDISGDYDIDVITRIPFREDVKSTWTYTLSGGIKYAEIYIDDHRYDMDFLNRKYTSKEVDRLNDIFNKACLEWEEGGNILVEGIVSPLDIMQCFALILLGIAILTVLVFLLLV